MREIKFRVYCKDPIESMRIVRQIDFCNREVQTFGHLNDKHEGYEEPDWVSFDRIEIMQYTGYRDCEANEIYEGDILSIETDDLNEEIKAVYWLDEIGALVVDLRYDWEYSCLEVGSLIEQYQGEYYSNIKVIGNIYENPELLK